MPVEGYGPGGRLPVPPPTPSAWHVVRPVLAALALLVSLVGFAVTAIIAGFVWSGCFITCSDGDHVDGAALGALAAVILASGPALVAALYRSRRWLRAAGIAFASAVALLTVWAALN